MSDGILIRCDADAAVGLGHLMRCLAIAGALRDLGVRVEFAMGELSSFAAQTLQDEGFCVHEIAGANSAFDKSAANAMLQFDRRSSTPNRCLSITTMRARSTFERFPTTRNCSARLTTKPSAIFPVSAGC
ncbi:MAG: hypothetical protein R3E58_10935 [Phycisphaerae bacterium]